MTRMVRIGMAWGVAALGVAAGCSSAHLGRDVPATTEPVAAKQSSSERSELLDRNETVAVFDRVSFHRCNGKTALCPINCGDSGDMAVFTIKKYLKYDKRGQEGDDKAATYRFLINNTLGEQKISPQMAETIRALRLGDYVLLSWDHLSITRDGASYSERPVTKLESLSPEKAQELLK